MVFTGVGGVVRCVMSSFFDSWAGFRFLLFVVVVVVVMSMLMAVLLVMFYNKIVNWHEKVIHMRKAPPSGSNGDAEEKTQSNNTIQSELEPKATSTNRFSERENGSWQQMFLFHSIQLEHSLDDL